MYVSSDTEYPASEMCLTMNDELMEEVDKISKELKEQDK